MEVMLSGHVTTPSTSIAMVDNSDKEVEGVRCRYKSNFCHSCDQMNFNSKYLYTFHLGTV